MGRRKGLCLSQGGPRGGSPAPGDSRQAYHVDVPRRQNFKAERGRSQPLYFANAGPPRGRSRSPPRGYNGPPLHEHRSQPRGFYISPLTERERRVLPPRGPPMGCNGPPPPQRREVTTDLHRRSNGMASHNMAEACSHAVESGTKDDSMPQCVSWSTCWSNGRRRVGRTDAGTRLIDLATDKGSVSANEYTQAIVDCSR